MSNELLKIIQQISQETVMSQKPVNVVFGTVTRENPLQVTTDQKLLLESDFLELCRNVTEYDIEMTVNHVTEKAQGGAKDPSFTSHDHMYKGRKVFRVHNGLKVGERVVMIGRSGGQSYVIIDRVG